MMAPARVVIATRKSPLALWQAEHVRALLQSRHADLSVELLGMTTLGDRILDRPLSSEGGKGLFVRKIDSLARRRAHPASSLKEVRASRTTSNSPPA